MMSKSNFILFLITALVGFFVFASMLNALSKQDLVFPVAELGNCKSEKECKSYCDNPDNFSQCIAFAEKYSLMSAKEIELAKKLGGKSGPGGCRSKNECETYCNNINNIEECLLFAEENNILAAEELEEAKKVSQALKKGAKLPGNCRNKKECDIYCDSSDKMEECVAFAEAAGFMTSEEAVMVKKTGGKGPGGCQGKEKCETYCDDSSHMEECINFAIENDLMPAEEKDEALKALAALKKGIKMPNCRSKKECDVYCSQPENILECVAFAEAAGFMTSEEAEMIKKTGGVGPGGCKGKDECEVFCDNPDNFEICVSFAESNGLMSKEETEMARKVGSKGGPGGCKGKEECETFCENPEQQEECFNFAVEHGLIPPEELEEMKRGMEMMKRGGPGGCKNREECETFCDDPANGEECFNFAEREGLIPPEELEEMKERMEMMEAGGPGGCRSEDECENYCSESVHQDECFNFAKEKGLIPPEELEEMEEGLKMMREMQEERGAEMMDEENFDEGFEEMPFEEMLEEEGFRTAPPTSEEIEELREIDSEGMEGEIQERIMKETQKIQRQIELQTQQEIQQQIQDQMQLQQEFQSPQTPTPPSSQIQSPSLLGVIIEPFLRIFGF